MVHWDVKPGTALLALCCPPGVSAGHAELRTAPGTLNSRIFATSLARLIRGWRGRRRRSRRTLDGGIGLLGLRAVFLALHRSPDHSTREEQKENQPAGFSPPVDFQRIEATNPAVPGAPATRHLIRVAGSVVPSELFASLEKIDAHVLAPSKQRSNLRRGPDQLAPGIEKT